MNSHLHIATRLVQVRQTLQSEFIGLEEIIDQFIDAVTPWCIMQDTQARPLVVNLWGLTGVGKTSLVRRFLQLWNEEEQVLWFNLGSKGYFKEILNSMHEMRAMDGHPGVIVFDEFQHAKTLGVGGKELDEPLDRMIWQLLDDGKFLYTNNWEDRHDLEELINGLERCLNEGVVIENGKVVAEVDYFINIFDKYTQSKQNESINALSERNVNLLFEFVKSEFKYKTELKRYFHQLNGTELLDFVRKVERSFCSTKEINLSKSLILVIGNLDEAYSMSREVSADQNPDTLHQESQKITFSAIKEALKERFRMEEISRLGNVHLIYPAFNSTFFREFISKELVDVALRFQPIFPGQLTFTSSVQDMLFEEGVTAAQGFRPLRSSIRLLVESSLVTLMQAAGFPQQEALTVDMQGDSIVLREGEKILSQKALHLPVREAKRKKRNPQTLAITAVHEAGHTLVYTILQGKLPKKVSITSSDAYTLGFVEGERLTDFASYDSILRDVAIRLAGKKAEQLVFGPDSITTGSEHDTQVATRRLLDLARSGTLFFQDLALESKYKGDGDLLFDTALEKEWVRVQMEKAGTLALELLETQNLAFRALIQILGQYLTLDTPTLEAALTAAGINIETVVQSYPPALDYQKSLEEFMKKGEQDFQAKNA
jgi:GTPase SAR1 family protein